MTIRHLIKLANKSNHRPIHRRFSTAVAATTSTTPLQPQTTMIYDRYAESVKQKLKKLENPDSRFLTHSSPIPTSQPLSEILSAPLTRVTTLPNGLRIATESTLSSKTATLGVYIEAGSRFEGEELNGVSYFVEQMRFKGTEKRGMKELEQGVEDIGGHLNGYTTREHTAFYVKVKDKDVGEGMDVLADILQNSRFDEGRMELERMIILKAMEETGKQQTQEVLFDHLHATAFQYTPLGRTIVGPAENIKKIGKEDLQNYVQTHYTAPRTVIVASGAVKHEDIVEQAKSLFTKLSTDPTTVSDLVAKEPAIFTGSEIRMLDDDIPLAQFAVAFEGASWTDPDSVALMVLQSMLGSWDKSANGGKHMGSELAQKVAINEIAESMMAFNYNYKDTGLFGVYAVAKPDCLDDLAFVIMHGITKLCYRVSDEDVIRARNQLKSSLLLQINGTSPVAEDTGRQMLIYGRRIPYAELIARIDSVDASTVKRVANRFLFDRDVAITAMGPIQGLPDYNWFRRRTYWLRY